MPTSPLAVGLLLLAASVASVYLLQLFATLPMLSAVLVLGLSALLTLVSQDLVPQIAIGSVSVYLPDVLFALLAGAAFVRVLGMRRWSLGQRALLVVCLLAVFAALRGVTVDVQPALNEFRSAFYFLAGAMYFATVTEAEWALRALTAAFVAAAGVVLLTAVLLWGPSPDFVAAPYEPGFRVIHAERALLLAQALLLTTPAWFRAGGRWPTRCLSVAFLVGVVLLQHRTVWVAAAAGLLVAARRDPRVGRAVVVLMIVASSVAVGLQVFVFTGGDSPSLTRSLEDKTSVVDTFVWRVGGW
jgi:hypothetical protein